MKTLTIKDLARTEELDRSAMAGVHGGMHAGMLKGYHPSWLASYDASKHDFSVDVSQLNSQVQDISSNNGINAAFNDKITTTIEPTQKAQNNSSVSF